MTETFVLLLMLLVGAIVAVRLFAGKGPSRRELKEQIEKAHERVPKDIRDIVKEEVVDLGIDRMPGGDGIDLGVLLRVWKRDTSIREGCDGIVQFQTRPGSAPANVTDLDVRVICVPVSGSPPAWQDPPPARGVFDEPPPPLDSLGETSLHDGTAPGADGEEAL